MISKIEKAIDTFSRGYNCAQAVFSTYAPSFGIDEAKALKISQGFGSGMGRLQEVCGAVTGAFMVIGAQNGSADLDNTPAKEDTYAQIKAFNTRFRERHGTILCRDLLGIDLNTEEGQQELWEKNLLSTVCARCVRDAAEIIEELDTQG